MNVAYFLARKVAASGQQSFSRLIIRIAIVAIALSISVMIVSTALIRGFKTEISNKIFGFWGHIHIMDTDVTRSFEAAPIDINQAFYPHLDTIERIGYLDRRKVAGVELGEELVEWQTHGGVRHIQAFANKPGIIKTKNEFEGIILKGIGSDFDWSILEEYLLEGVPIQLTDSTASEDIIISQQTASRLKLKIGDRFIVHFVKGNQQLRRRFQICGIYKTGLEEYDRKFALVDIRRVQNLLGWEANQVGGFEVFIDDIRDLDQLNEYIYIEEIPNDLFSQTIRDKFPSIFEWLALQDINEIVILILMLIVAIINMVTALMILILERTNMIGILKAMGTRNWSIRQIFLFYAAYIIGIGLFWGNLIGLALCFIQDRFELIQLSEADYYLSVAPIQLDVWTLLFLNVGTLLVTLIFLILPSYLVTSITPVKAIRFK
ncbi:MAG: FtsX-like permease family protein [Bacteroidota bacterium]